MHEEESAFRLHKRRKRLLCNHTVQGDSQTKCSKTDSGKGNRRPQKGPVYLPKFVNRLITSKLLEINLRPVLIVGMGRNSIAKKTGKIRKVTAAVFYINPLNKLSIMCVRILNGFVELIPYSQYKLKSRLEYVSAIYKQKAIYNSTISQKQVGCPEEAGIFVL